MRCIPASRLICNEKDRFLPDMAMADNDLHENGNIAGSPEHPTDRIRNAGVGRMIDHTTSEGARSAVLAYWKDGSCF
jgi:hypothetical protein